MLDQIFHISYHSTCYMFFQHNCHRKSSSHRCPKTSCEKDDEKINIALNHDVYYYKVFYIITKNIFQLFSAQLIICFKSMLITCHRLRQRKDTHNRPRLGPQKDRTESQPHGSRKTCELFPIMPYTIREKLKFLYKT